MKAKSIHSFYFFLSIITLGCFDQPEFPIEPKIEYESIYFREIGTFSDPDSLILKLKFQDGDGDLGIEKITVNGGQTIDNINDPFHDSNFYLANGTGGLLEVGTETFYTDTVKNGIAEFVPIKVITRRGQSGKLVTLKTKKQASYQYLPGFTKNKAECRDYTLQNLFVFINDWGMLEKNHHYIKDTLTDGLGNVFIHLKDTVYFKFNPNHYNIGVDFLVKKNNGFVEFDWREEFCTTYDGRFPLLTDTSSPLDGILIYAMGSTGFKTIFGSQTLKLRVAIQDRTFHKSDTIYTPEFTLEKIKNE